MGQLTLYTTSENDWVLFTCFLFFSFHVIFLYTQSFFSGQRRIGSINKEVEVLIHSSSCANLSPAK